MNKEKIKMLIELADTVEEADSIIIEKTGYQTVKEKLAFLNGMFTFELIGRHDVKGTTEEESITMDYFSALHAIINEKWGA